MKYSKISFVVILTFLLSCRENSTSLDSTILLNSHASSNISTDKVVPQSTNQVIKAFNNELPLCGSGGTIYPINPNYPSLNYGVVAYSTDPLLDYCKTCKDLSHALVDYIETFRVQNTSSIVHKFYGYDGESSYNSINSIDGLPLQELVYQFGQDGDNENMYGSIFPYGTTMQPNVVNTIVQSIIQQIDNAHVGRIAVIHVYMDSLLCIPSYKFVRVKIKYIAV